MVGLVVAEPVRRFWAVGANLSRVEPPQTFFGHDAGYPGSQTGPYFFTPTPFDQSKADAQDPGGWDKILKARNIFADDPGPMIVMWETYEAVTHGPMPCTYRFITDHGDTFKI